MQKEAQETESSASVLLLPFLLLQFKPGLLFRLLLQAGPDFPFFLQLLALQA